jgi:hypothetical protein
MRSDFKRFLPFFVLPFLFAACESGTGPRDGGTVSIMLTDAPGDFQNAIVTISRIELLRDEEGDDEANDDGVPGNRIVLLDEPVTVDLLTLQNEVMEIVGETPVPGGRYSQLRLVITDGLIVVEQEDGSARVYASSSDFAVDQGFTRDGTLMMPSFAQSGLKINLPADTRDIDGDDNAILVDFNVAESFGHQAGNSGMWVMHPVIHASSFTTTGSITVAVVLGEGVTLPTIGETAITMPMVNAVLDRNGDVIPVAFSDANADGTWEATFRFLPPGAYTVGLGVPTGLVLTTDPALPFTFNVTSGQTATQTFTITAAGTQ